MKMSAREVELSGGAPWGFRMHGGADQNQPLRISRVNPGRKASLSGIREGDVITSINGKATRDMSNSDAHAMLRSAGPVLRLGLNEDREMSPRRRSIGKTTELKRPSQLISEINSGRATPQAPVYATIRPATSNNKLSSPIQSLNSPLNSTPLIKSVSPELLKFHPTNPFCSTLPNYTSTSKLPIPNGKPSNSPTHRSTKLTDPFKNEHELKLSSFFSKKFDSGPSTVCCSYESQVNNSYDTPKKCSSSDKYSSFSDSQVLSESRKIKDTKDNINPFDSKNNDIRHNLTCSDERINSKPLNGSTLNYSKSDGDFRLNDDVIKHSTISEKNISEVEEIKIIRKITLNGSSENRNHQNGGLNYYDDKESKFDTGTLKSKSPNERNVPATTKKNDFVKNNIEKSENVKRQFCHNISIYKCPEDISFEDDHTSQALSSKPPVKSPVTSNATTPTNKPIWRPGASPGGEAPSAPSPSAPPPPPPPPVWTPGSNTTSPQIPRKTYRPVHFEDTPPSRRKFGNSDQNGCTSGSESEGRLRTSQSAPVTGLNSLGSTSRLPRAQNPTVTLLQKAREGQIPRGPSNIPTERDPRLPRDRPSPPKGDPVHALRKEYASEGEGDRSDYERSRKMTDAKKKVEGIGPITKDGMPVALRSEVKDPSRWYKKMYDTIHKNKFDEDYVTIRYKNRRGESQRPSSNRSQYAYFDPRSGYLSEPEGGLRLTTSTWSDAYDSDVTSGPRRRTASVQEERRYDDGSPYLPNNKYSTLASARARQEVYKNQPGRIENYVPGKSSVIDKEAKQWWDEVMDIFDGQNESGTQSQSQASPKEKKDLTSAILSKSNMARALKESGYESDSTLIFRRREDTEAPLSPAERRAAYRDLQAGGEPPIRGFRSPAPPRTESPSRRYVESDVNIHYRCPVRHDPLPLVPERELARQQAEHMKRLYREQRRNKYLQELQDMQNRRHQDNFMPSQKTIVPLNRYDEAEKIIAKALYTFNGQTARELSFKKGDIINVRRQIDSNWYEGEVHGKIGLFPYNYVELLKSDGVQTLKKTAVVEGKARAKFDFIAQTNLELPLKKGEVVVLTRRIDHNWWEGRNGNKTGIFPDSYVTILQEPSQNKPEPQPILTTPKPVASPAAHGLLNGVDKRSMGAHRYTPQLNSPALSNAPPADIPLQGYITKSTSSLSASERGYGPPTGAGVDLNNSEPLYVDTNAEAVPYRAMYKYRPQNPDELELNEGDTVYVLEKCDDGWYVGSSQRTGRFGTFPGNYVERI